ncbi:hypothetical protein CRUP_005394 [Coryphaenoides rupestris]|nr:hypothetical protein CRUP_005394 [Coryphaenoides rupestris]
MLRIFCVSRNTRGVFVVGLLDAEDLRRAAPLPHRTRNNRMWPNQGPPNPAFPPAYNPAYPSAPPHGAFPQAPNPAFPPGQFPAYPAGVHPPMNPGAAMPPPMHPGAMPYGVPGQQPYPGAPGAYPGVFPGGAHPGPYPHSPKSGHSKGDHKSGHKGDHKGHHKGGHKGHCPSGGVGGMGMGMGVGMAGHKLDKKMKKKMKKGHKSHKHGGKLVWTITPYDSSIAHARACGGSALALSAAAPPRRLTPPRRPRLRGRPATPPFHADPTPFHAGGPLSRSSPPPVPVRTDRVLEEDGEADGEAEGRCLNAPAIATGCD